MAHRSEQAREQRALNRERNRLADVQQFFYDLAEANRIRAEEFNACAGQRGGIDYASARTGAFTMSDLTSSRK